MGNYDSLLQIALCYLFSYATQQKYISAQRSFEQILAFKPYKTICKSTQEDALYRQGALNLLELNKGEKSITMARNFLKSANEDNRHEQANELLNLIGKTDFVKRY